MVLVDSPTNLQDLDRAPQAIAFIHFDWSGQSFQSLKTVQHLESILWANVSVYRLEPDKSADAADWLIRVSGRHQQEFSGGGYGSVLWLKVGTVLDWVRFAAKSGLEQLMERTCRAFP